MLEPDLTYINLPHAHTIVGRFAYHLAHRANPDAESTVRLRNLLDQLEEALGGYVTDPPAEEALAAAVRVAEIARTFVSELVGHGIRSERLGQCVRNFFECLGYPREGAARSLECGERADSPLRP